MYVFCTACVLCVCVPCPLLCPVSRPCGIFVKNCIIHTYSKSRERELTESVVASVVMVSRHRHRQRHPAWPGLVRSSCLHMAGCTAHISFKIYKLTILNINSYLCIFRYKSEKFRMQNAHESCRPPTRRWCCCTNLPRPLSLTSVPVILWLSLFHMYICEGLLRVRVCVWVSECVNCICRYILFNKIFSTVYCWFK